MTTAPSMSGPFDVQALYAALDAKRVTLGLSWTGTARAIGNVSPSTVTRARHADDLEADGMLQMARWLGLAPETFARDRASASPVPMTVAAAGTPGVLRVDTHTLYAVLDAQRTARGLTWTQVAAELEAVRATASGLTDLRSGSRTSAQVLLASARWLERTTESLTRLAER
jgi:hypothetical protein